MPTTIAGAHEKSPQVSVIIPCTNASAQIGRCLQSLHQITLETAEYEVIFVSAGPEDDISALISAECAISRNWSFLRTEAHEASFADLLNCGIKAARGQYVFLLDCDDEILPDALGAYLNHAQRTGADIVRGHLLIEEESGRRAINRLNEWSEDMSKSERILQIVREQTPTVCCLFRRSIILQNPFEFQNEIAIRENNIFFMRILGASESIEYIDQPASVHLTTDIPSPSCAPEYGERELRNHLAAWREASAILQKHDIDWVALHFQAELQASLNSIIFFNSGDITPETFHEFREFLERNTRTIDTFTISPRLREIINIVCTGNFPAFRRACRPRLLIAGYDLKFITGILDRLDPYYDITIDAWAGHNHHNEVASRAALEWAELIWCEWLLGNAAWYARNRKPDQIIITRMHRFELGRNFGDDPAIKGVNSVVAVSTLFMERLLERFPSIPRDKARLLHNYVDTSAYHRSTDLERRFRLGVIGILPSRKGFARNLSILARLRRIDPRYTLSVYGKNPGDLDWLMKIPEEMSYFGACDEIIAREHLSDAITFHGHVDISKALAENGTGIILSQSESVRELPCFESFHLAVADGFSSGGVGLVQYWEGSEFVWPENFIFPDEDRLVERILYYRDNTDAYERDAESGARFVQEHYGVEQFVTEFVRLFRLEIEGQSLRLQHLPIPMDQ